MTRDEIGRRVDSIAAQTDDDEAAHVAEDNLFEDVLRAIAGGADDAPGLAAEALKSCDLEFSRWCA
jgi:hypothetical protein